MATHSNILAWKIPWTRGACRATVHGDRKSQTRLKQLSTHACTIKIKLSPSTPVSPYNINDTFFSGLIPTCICQHLLNSLRSFTSSRFLNSSLFLVLIFLPPNNLWGSLQLHCGQREALIPPQLIEL